MENKKRVLNSLNFSQEHFMKTGFSSIMKDSHNKKDIQEFFNDKLKRRNYSNYINLLKQDILSLDMNIKNKKEFLEDFLDRKNKEISTFAIFKDNTNTFNSNKDKMLLSKIRSLIDEIGKENITTELDSLVTNSKNIDFLLRKYDLSININKENSKETLIEKLFLELSLNDIFFRLRRNILLILLNYRRFGDIYLFLFIIFLYC